MKVKEAAEKTLTAFDAQLEAQGVAVPKRQYVAPGSGIPWDEEQLVVVLQTISQGRPGAPQAQAFRSGAEVFVVQMAVVLVRDVPNFQNEAIVQSMIPSAKEMNAAGLIQMADAEALYKAAVAIHAANTITSPGVDFTVGECMPVGPDGGFAGTRQLIEFSL